MSEPQMSAPGRRWQGKSSVGWAHWMLFTAALLIVTAAPVVAVLGLLLSWGRIVVLTAVAVIVVAVILVAVVWKLANRASDRLDAQAGSEIAKLPSFAEHNGLRYADDDTAVARTLQNGRSSAGHVIAGQVQGRPAAICWWRRTQAGTELQSLYLAVALPAVIPPIEVSVVTAREFAPGAHREHLRFEDEDFNQRYIVEAKDHSPEAARYATDVFSQRAIDWLLTVEPFYFSIRDGLIRCDGPGVLDIEGYQTMLDRATALAQLVNSVPEFVWTRYGKPAPQPLLSTMDKR